ncbi:DUF551 domain-containing protein [Klebsiella variicola]
MTSKLTRERLEKIKSWRETYDTGSNVMLPAEEAEELARIALAAMDSEPVALQPELAKVIYHFRDWNEGFPVERFKADYVISWMLANYPPAQPAPVVPEGLNPETTDLVLRFASALADKLYKAEQKYGRSTDWMKDDWYDDCLQSLWEHIEKGDPRDVAAYCAFMWYHGWVTTDYDRNVQNAYRAAMLAADPQLPDSDPATVPGKWIPVSEQMPEVGDIVLTAMGGVVNVGETECSAANCRFFTSVISGRELPATHWMPLPAAPQEVSDA